MDYITQGYIDKIKTLEELKLAISSHKEKDFIVQTFLSQLDNEITQNHMKLDRMRPKFNTIQCIQCLLYTDKESTVALPHAKTICKACLQTITGMMVSSEFETLYDLPEGTIKQHATSDKNPLGAYLSIGLVRKSGRNWLIHQQLWELFYKEKYAHKNEKVV